MPLQRRLLLAGFTALLAPCSKAAPAKAAVPLNWLLRRSGASVHSFSSEFGAGWVAANLVPSDEQLAEASVTELLWSSGSGVPFPHWVVFDLGQPRWITQLVFNNALREEADHPGISARQLVVHAGPTLERLQKVASFELERNRDGQAVSLDPVEARFLKLTISSNWGHPWYTELGASQALDDGRRPGDLALTLRSTGKVDLYGIYFDFGSAKLRPESDATLGKIVAYHRANPKDRLIVEGHTDDVGSEKVNSELSGKRAAAVVGELVRRGFPASLLQAVGRGAMDPVAPNSSDAGRAKNRRVTLVRT